MQPTRILLVLFLLFSPAIVTGQTLSLVIDRQMYPELELAENPPVPYDLDGNRMTREWVQVRYNKNGQFEVRGLALRSGICAGSWFKPFEIAAEHSLPWDSILVGMMLGPTADGKDRYVVFGTRGEYEITVSYGC